MKYFVGVAPKGLPENQRLKQVFGKIKRTVSDWKDTVRWSQPPLWHLTICFLGKKTSDQVDQVQKILEAWTPSEPIQLRLYGLGAFPSPEHGRVLWVGVRENKSFLRLQESLQTDLLKQNLMIPDDHDFKPHVTLARFRNAGNLQSLINLAPKTDFGEYDIDELILFKSVVQGNMSKYIPLFTRKI